MAVATSDRWIENRATQGFQALRFGELWGARELIYFLALRDFKARYKQAAFGIGWAVVQPIAGVVVFAFVFRHLAGVSSEGMPYLVFALIGFLVWSYFSTSLNSATSSLITNTSLVTKVYFPRMAAPVASLLPGMVNLFVGFGLLAILMIVYGIVPGLPLLALPACLLAAIAVAVGPGLLLSTLYVKYRDVASMIGLLTQLWLLASPIAYPSSLVTGGWSWLYAANPMVGLIDAFRWSLAGGPWPGADLAVSAGVALALLVIGFAYFQRSERRFADVI